ncbi:MAG: RHS repeat-associated core domain-containing protein, partial [Planctomyces sp.]
WVQGEIDRRLDVNNNGRLETGPPIDPANGLPISNWDDDDDLSLFTKEFVALYEWRLNNEPTPPDPTTALFDGTGAGRGKLSREDIDNRIGAAGMWWDPHLGIYHVRHRAYDPRLGRFLQPDPIGVAGGWNVFEYVGGDPANLIDPSGLASQFATSPVTLSVDHGVTATDCGCGLPTVATSFTSTSSESSASNGRGGRKGDAFDMFGVGADRLNERTRAGSSPRSESANELRRDILNAQHIAGEFVQGAKEAASDPDVYVDAARWLPVVGQGIAVVDTVSALASGDYGAALESLAGIVVGRLLSGVSTSPSIHLANQPSWAHNLARPGVIYHNAPSVRAARPCLTDHPGRGGGGSVG